jgi:hypothetical protein
VLRPARRCRMIAARRRRRVSRTEQSVGEPSPRAGPRTDVSPLHHSRPA